MLLKGPWAEDGQTFSPEDQHRNKDGVGGQDQARWKGSDVYEQGPGFQRTELRLDMRSGRLRIPVRCVSVFCVCVLGICELWEAPDLYVNTNIQDEGRWRVLKACGA